MDKAEIGIAAPAQAKLPAADPGLLARKWNWLRDLPARSALRACNHPRVRGLLGQRHASALASHQPRLPSLSASDRQIVDTIERDGVFMTTLDALGLPGSDDMVRAGRALATGFAGQARARAAAGEVFLYVPPERLLAHPEIFSWGLHDRLLDIAEAYIGLRPAYDGVCLNYTVADGREISTRKWHRDWEDRRMLKACVYLHDVDAGGGPFEIIRRPDTMQSDADGFVYDLADDASLRRWLDGDLERYKLSCEGPAGTVIFMDTARFFHRGKPATTSDRAALFYSYFADRPRHPFLCERSGMGRRDIARLAGSLPERQRAAAQWRQRLPWLLRAIPPARL